MNNLNYLPTRLKELRKKNHFSQTYVAEYLNLSRQSISNWETGKTVPDLDNLLLLAKLYNVSMDELLDNNRTKTTDESANELPLKIISYIETIGLSVILLLSTLFPFVPLLFSSFIILWMKKHHRKYAIVYALCVICFIIGIYNSFIFVIHFTPNHGTPIIQQV